MIKFKKLHENAIIPTRAEPGAAGFDLYYCGEGKSRILVSGTRIFVQTGISMSIPDNYAAIIKPRSGLASKHGIDVLGGVIDSSYRGEIIVILVNHGNDDLEIKSGDRIAQLIVTPIVTDFEVVDDLDETERGSDGFGSTGR